MPTENHKDLANTIRALAMDSVQRANSGHPGMPMGMADVATVLFRNHLKFDPAAPEWPDRDRFILSAGHGSMLLYSLLYLTGYADMTLDELKNFRQLGARTAGHPEFGHASGIETTTGPLGQGLANGVGMALAERLLNARFGDELVDHFTYVLAGDGCLMEGISHEAVSLAGHLRLNKLIVLFDDNGISIDGSTDLSVSDDQIIRFRASGWNTMRIDGHNPEDIDRAIAGAREADRPTLIACRTVIGFGAPTKAGTAKTHGAPLGDEEIAGAREQLGWPYLPFEIPDDILTSWREIGRQGTASRNEWESRLSGSDKRDDFERGQKGDLGPDWQDALDRYIDGLIEEKPKVATRAASQNALQVLTRAIPELIGGSADLTGSNNTKSDVMDPVNAEDYSGRYIYYGVREHGMAAAMNGLALHKGVIPYGGTFLVFTDYCRPSIRLSALMGQRVVYVMTHDSIGLGEDGPTHQPVEHLAALRAIPNTLVFRPCDAVETAECWALALENTDGPSILALSRQGLPTCKETNDRAETSARGAYVLKEAGDERKVTLVATGSEVQIALEAREILESRGIGAAVVSAPCLELFARQDVEYRKKVLGEGTLKVGIEAAIRQGWDSVLGSDGGFVGMTGFGASAPAPALYDHFGITPEKVVDAVTAAL